MSHDAQHFVENYLSEFNGTRVVIEREWWEGDPPPSQEERDEMAMHANQDVAFDTGAYDDAEDELWDMTRRER